MGRHRPMFPESIVSKPGSVGTREEQIWTNRGGQIVRIAKILRDFIKYV
jgi:hypothetical protein